MTLIEGLWCISTLGASLSVIGMLYLYRNMRTSLALIALRVNELCWDVKLEKFINLTRSDNGSRVQGMAEDTKVEQ
jgi:hypothetical protein